MTKQSESALQCTLVSMLRQLYPKFLISLSMSGISLNGTAKQNAMTIQHQRQMGFENGIPDFTLYIPSGKTIQFELKTSTGKQSPDQIEVEAKLKSLGHNYYLIRDIYEPFKIIANHTIYADRVAAFEALDIEHDRGRIINDFLYFEAGTPIQEVLDNLKPIYHI